MGRVAPCSTKGRDIISFFRKASPLAERCWYISMTGFIEEAKTVASKKGILFSAKRKCRFSKISSKRYEKKTQKKGIYVAKKKSCDILVT